MRKGKLSVKQRNMICQDYIDGLSSTKVAKKHSISSQSVLYILKKKYTMRYDGRNNIKKLYSFLYKDATVYMERKHKIFLDEIS